MRSLLFNLFFYVWTTVYCLAVLPAYPFLSPRGDAAGREGWQRVMLAGLRVIVGLTYEVRGREHLPARPVIIASKHQSAWETLAFHALVPRSRSALKEELTRIPVFGWYLLRAGSIRIDRGAGSRAIRSLVEGARRAAAEGLSVLIFPEGTRRTPGDPPDYKPGVAALYSALRLPVVPVGAELRPVLAHVAEFIKHPGPDRGRVPAADSARARPQAVHGAAGALDRDRHRPLGG